MIFPFLIPYLNGFKSFVKAPITWLIFLVNLLVYLSSYEINNQLDVVWTQQTTNSTFMEMQGKIYADYVLQNKEFYDQFTQDLALQVQKGYKQSSLMMATFAIKDPSFVHTGSYNMKYKDPVAFKFWQSKFHTILNSRAEHPSHLLGVSYKNASPLTWITYQFVHGDLMHFLVNMIFLMFFGAFIERLCGSLTMLLIYLGSGFIGAGTYVVWSGISTIPLVGRQ